MTSSRRRIDPLARLFTTWLGGPIGRYAGPRRLSPLFVLFLVTTATFAIGVVLKAPCIGAEYADPQRTPEFGWRSSERGWDDSVEGWNDRQHAFVNLCYSDVAYLYRERGFAEGFVAYLDAGDHRVLEYPVLTGAVMQATAWATDILGSGYAIDDSMLFFALTVLLMFGCALVVVWALRRMGGRYRWTAMFVAASPSLALASVINWDLLAVAVTTCALLAWSRSRTVLAGVLLGLGAAIKLYPVLLLGPLLILAIRTRRLAAGAEAVFAAALAWLAVNLPLLLLVGDRWGEFWTFNSGRAADFGSIWLVTGIGVGSPTVVNLLSLGLFGAACVGIAVLGLIADRPPRLAQLAFLVVAAFCLFNKVYSPQYVLWLLPLVALARPVWRDWAIWQAAEAFYWVMVWLYLAGSTAPADGGQDHFYLIAVLFRFGATAYLCAQVIRDILTPERGAARAGGREGLSEDPLDGPFAKTRHEAGGQQEEVALR